MQQLTTYDGNIHTYVVEFSSWKELSARDEKRLDLYFKNSEIANTLEKC